MDKFILDEDGFEDIDVGDTLSDGLAEDLFNLFNSFIEASKLEEDFISHDSLMIHFREHCLGNSDRRSTRTKVFYDFKKPSEYGKYELLVSKKLETPDKIITSFFDPDVIKALMNLFRGNYSIEFTYVCGWHQQRNLYISSFSSDVTTNYSANNTLDLCIKAKNGRTITLYPLDAHYFQTKFNNILANHSDTDQQYYFNDITIR